MDMPERLSSSLKNKKRKLWSLQYYAAVVANGKHLRMEIDTGATLSLISKPHTVVCG